MGNHNRIVFGPTLYFIPINRNRNSIRLLELAHTAAWNGRWAITFPLYLIQPNFKLRKRMSGKTGRSMQYPIC